MFLHLTGIRHGRSGHMPAGYIARPALNEDVNPNQDPMGSSIPGRANPANAGRAMPPNSDLKIDRAGVSRVKTGGRLS